MLLLKGVVRREFDQVVVWSIDRLGRSLQDLIAVLNELREKRCDLYVHKQALDTSTSSGKMLFQMLGVFSEFEREIIRERTSQVSNVLGHKASGLDDEA
jgi:DNA invertase Pin-like site-specific DNA recombinase